MGKVSVYTDMRTQARGTDTHNKMSKQKHVGIWTEDWSETITVEWVTLFGEKMGEPRRFIQEYKKGDGIVCRSKKELQEKIAQYAGKLVAQADTQTQREYERERRAHAQLMDMGAGYRD